MTVCTELWIAFLTIGIVMSEHAMSHFVFIFIALMFFLVSVEHYAEYYPYQSHEDDHDPNNQTNGYPSLNAQADPVCIFIIQS